jgi:methyl coenzyme M reductase subunit C-like uncharacterized protein (methanogenesis marker protein 7)
VLPTISMESLKIGVSTTRMKKGKKYQILRNITNKRKKMINKRKKRDLKEDFTSPFII